MTTRASAADVVAAASPTQGGTMARARCCALRWMWTIVALVATAALAPGALAQGSAAYPSRSIRFVVPYAPGGLPDTVARIVAQRLGERIGQSVVVDNRPGANGGIAATVLASAPADGYSFLVTDGSMLSINPR